MRKSTYILVIAAFIWITGCTSGKEKEPEATAGSDKNTFVVSKEQFIDSKMETGPMQPVDFPVTVTATGMIDVPPQNKAVVSSFVEGYVTKTYLLIGDKVKKGQQLVTIENPEFVAFQQEYAEAKVQLNYLKSEYERQKILFEEKIASEKKFLKAESDYRKTLSKYNGLKKKLQLLHIDPAAVEKGTYTTTIKIFAPISGSITDIDVAIGQHISPAEKIIEIVNTDHIHLELNVFEKDVIKVKEGQQILFTIPEASSEKYPAEVHLVGSSVDLNTRTVKVHGHPDKDLNIHLSTGMFIEAKIFIRNDSHPALPDESVVNLEDGNDYVLLLKEEKDDAYIFEKRRVIIGQVHDGMAEIRNHASFKAGSKFLLKQSFSLLKN